MNTQYKHSLYNAVAKSQPTKATESDFGHNSQKYVQWSARAKAGFTKVLKINKGRQQQEIM